MTRIDREEGRIVSVVYCHDFRCDFTSRNASQMLPKIDRGKHLGRRLSRDEVYKLLKNIMLTLFYSLPGKKRAGSSWEWLSV